MTREEAQKILTMWMVSSRGADGQRGYIEGWFDKDDVEAFRMAIEALSERPTESDFISKAKVLETYSELYWFDSDCEVVSKAEVDKIYERLQSLSSADRPTGWIPVSERLPEVDVEVLTTTDWSDVLIAWLNKDCAWETEEHILDNDEILAWMPLPEPYKGGDTE